MQRIFNAVACRLTLPALLLLCGCTYHLEGVVVSGPVAQVQVVSSDDPRLQGPGLEHAQVNLTIDPSSLGAERLRPVTTDSHGQFSVPVSQTGAGVLKYEVSLYCRHAGCAPVQETMDLPPSWKRLLIVLAPGQDQPMPTDLHDEAKEWQDQMRR
jgi:hypothetical protein